MRILWIDRPAKRPDFEPDEGIGAFLWGAVSLVLAWVTILLLLAF